MANYAAKYGAQLNAGNEFLAQLKAKRNPLSLVPAPVAARYTVAGYYNPSSETYAETSDPVLAASWIKPNTSTRTVRSQGKVTYRGGSRRRKTRKSRK
jgi:hypothetical protein